MKNLKYKIFSLIFSTSAILSCVTVPAHAAEGQIKNVIYLMPDGGGFGQYDYANAFKQYGGFDTTKFPTAQQRDTTPMFITDYLAGAVRTKSANAAITDSAAGATTYATGTKTNNGYLSLTPEKTPRATLLEAAQEKGMSTGLVSQVYFYHASPAAFASHWYDRNDYAEIAEQIENQDVDVVLCGGYGAIEDGSMSIKTPEAMGYTIVDTKEELSAVQPGDRVWGNFWSGGAPLDYLKGADQPYFPEFVQAAITALSDNENGFFLFAEVSHTDNHSNNALHAVSEYNVFSDAFEVAVNFAKERDDTIVIGIPDHDTGGMTYDPETIDELLPLLAKGENPDSIVWAGSTNHTSQNVPCFMYVPEGVDVIPGLNPNVGDTPETRGDPVAQTGDYVIENIDMAAHVSDLLGFDLDALTEELFVDVTSIGTYTPEGRFEFASGNKYVYPNQSVYYDNGEEISTDGRISLYVNGSFYVPSQMVEEDDWNYTGGKMNGFFGSGTQEDPYLIQNPYDFIEFSYNLGNGQTYADTYFEQTKDLDMSLYTSEYNGVSSAATFAGVYNGGGHSVNAIISTASDSCVFPKVSGTIMNFGTTGTLTSKGAYAAGIARTLTPKGKIVNCYSTMSIAGNAVAGLVYNQYGKISNSYFDGTITARKGINALALKHGNGKFENCYYNKKLHQYGAKGIKGMTEEAILDGFADTLNSGRAAAAAAAGVAESDVAYWKQDASGKPYLYNPEPVVESVVVTPSAVTVKKGESVQLSAAVLGQYSPSQEVNWELSPSSSEGSTITSEGLLTISETETETSFKVLAKSKIDGSKVGLCEVTVE